MFNPLASHEAFRKRMLKDLSALDPVEKTVVQLMSIFYESVNRTTLLNTLNATGARQPDGKVFKHESLRPIVDRLLQQGWIEVSGQEIVCPRALVEPLTRAAIADGGFKALADAVQAEEPIFKSSWNNRYEYRTYERGIREIRIALHQKDWALAEFHMNGLRQSYYRPQIPIPLLLLLFSDPFDADIVKELPDELKCEVLREVLDDAMLRLIPQPGALALLEEYCRRPKAENLYLMKMVLAEQCILRGRWAEARALTPNPDLAGDLEIQGALEFLEGRDAAAIDNFESALGQVRRGARKRTGVLLSTTGLFYPLAMLRGGGAALRKAAAYLEQMKKNKDAFYKNIHYALGGVLDLLEGRKPDRDVLAATAERAQMEGALSVLLCNLVLYWCGATTQAKRSVDILTRLAAAAQESGFAWLAREAAALLGRVDRDSVPALLANPLALAPDCQGPLLADMIKREAAWERALAAIAALGAPPGKAAAEESASGPQSRLIWQITLWRNADMASLQPMEQVRGARGGWTKGRAVALKRLAQEGSSLDWLTPQDRKVCASLAPLPYARYGQPTYDFDLSKALPALAGHPLVFWADLPDAPVEVVTGRPELHVEPTGDQLKITLEPQLHENDRVRVVRESATRARVILVTPEQQRLAAILGSGLSIPAAARERALAALAAVAPLVSVHSGVGAVGGEALEEAEADPRPHLLLTPAGRGLRIELVVRPLGEAGPICPPGRGGATLIAELEGRRVQARRDLDLERQGAMTLMAALPGLDGNELEGGAAWTLEDPEECLDLLSALREAPEGGAVVEWPKGGRLAVSRPASFAQLRLAIRGERDWFSLSGELRADEGRTIELQQLLALLAASPGRYLPLGEGQFLTLTREFRRRLEELRDLAERRGKKLQFQPIAAPVVEELTAGSGALKTDKQWTGLLERIREAAALAPVVPSTLAAELRDYQRVGYEWLARLAHWGAGACLADDMGLGKTVQALALLLARAAEGPALIVAPTSVALNWAAEAARFAPTLNIKMFAPGADRRALVEGLGAFDVLVTSYDLMQREEELVAGRRWHTIVLDEAQAIKNMATRRSKAAMKLQGDFRLITTGTPIENHLGELWNLFRFLNPGLLGSLERFNERFAGPIERQQDRAARGRLRRILQPFILRRTRAQVLEELPPRTEIQLEVEQSAEEAAFYEALRRQALERIAKSDTAVEKQRFQILAEIMRLRRACCNPSLVAPEAGVPSAKLEAFGELLAELRESGHKALVFSQFTDHLAIIREYLDGQGVKYQYLDGSTPPEQRQRAIAAFQGGQGELFLISLKAGGTGLNLTAADYVIHLDPWWNPAVEDQATGRAHRMGQEHPVTVYRLVARGTIEQKIVELHRYKRDLADSLLEGTETAGRLTPEELLALLREG